MNNDKFKNSQVEKYEDAVYKLLLYNDTVNSFEHVMECLIIYLLKTPTEAYCISHEVHFIGRVLLFGSSNYDDVLAIYKVLLAEGLTVSIE